MVNSNHLQPFNSSKHIGNTSSEQYSEKCSEFPNGFPVSFFIFFGCSEISYCYLPVSGIWLTMWWKCIHKVSFLINKFFLRLKSIVGWSVDRNLCAKFAVGWNPYTFSYYHDKRENQWYSSHKNNSGGRQWKENWKMLFFCIIISEIKSCNSMRRKKETKKKITIR